MLKESLKGFMLTFGLLIGLVGFVPAAHALRAGDSFCDGAGTMYVYICHRTHTGTPMGCSWEPLGSC